MVLTALLGHSRTGKRQLGSQICPHADNSSFVPHTNVLSCPTGEENWRKNRYDGRKRYSSVITRAIRVEPSAKFQSDDFSRLVRNAFVRIAVETFLRSVRASFNTAKRNTRWLNFSCSLERVDFSVDLNVEVLTSDDHHSQDHARYYVWRHDGCFFRWILSVSYLWKFIALLVSNERCPLIFIPYLLP